MTSGTRPHLRARWIDSTLGDLRFAPVRTGLTSLDGQVQILEGVKPGTTVIVYSEKDIGARSRITVVETLAGQQP